MLLFAAGAPRLNRFVQLLLAAIVLTFLGWTFLTHSSFGERIQRQIPLYKDVGEQRTQHPIDDLRIKADQELEDLLAKETHEVQAAELAYQQRRGRRPPPGFDTWFKFAQDNNAVIVEEFFDRIYDDLAPFWAFRALDMRLQARAWVFRISVRNGTAHIHGDEVQREWLDLWADMIGTIAQYLPDLDIPINEMDESRIVTPWEEIDVFMQIEKRSRKLVAASAAVTEFSETAVKDDQVVPPFDFAFSGEGPYWDLAVVGCPPHSPARNGYAAESDFARPPPLPSGRPDHSYKGYVSNWTLTKSPCDNPKLQALHGTFVEPISIANSRKLFPMFGGSKLPMNNEILLPPAMYWTRNPFYSGGDQHGGSWVSKHDKLIWRGAASGGRNREENWTRFQRHRFVAMVNGTTARQAEMSVDPPPNFDIPGHGAYQLAASKGGYLGEWLDKVADAGFVHLLCFPDPNPPFCSYTDPWYKVEKSMPMSEQYDYKYLPDIDGNSFSGRYRGFLLSSSLPIKATIYDEWHDSRLVPWKHFVPMDNTFADIYGILEYFLGAGDKAGHDDVAKSIALDGKAWAEKVLRREDMQIYVYRLLLEYARLCDDNRDKLAYLPSG